MEKENAQDHQNQSSMSMVKQQEEEDQQQQQQQAEEEEEHQRLKIIIVSTTVEQDPCLPKKENEEDLMSCLQGTSSSSSKNEEAPTLPRGGRRRTVTSSSACTSGRERLQRHRNEVAGKVWIPDIWGQEDLLKDWIDCSQFDACLVPTGVVSARAALVHQATTTPNSSPLRVHHSTRPSGPPT